MVRMPSHGASDRNCFQYKIVIQLFNNIATPYSILLIFVQIMFSEKAPKGQNSLESWLQRPNISQCSTYLESHFPFGFDD